MNNKVELFVVSHKKLDRSFYHDRSIIYVGKHSDFYKEEQDFSDNSGENIADLNYTYCECTAIYWIYKNSNADVVGVEHYRRFFRNFFNLKSKKYFVKKLKKYDYILPFQYYMINTVKKDLIKHHGQFSYDILKEAFENVFPEHLDCFNKVMNSHHLTLFNMMVAKKSDFDKYSDFIFPILDYVFKNCEIPTDPVQRRLVGFLSERLMNIFLEKEKKVRKLKVKHRLVLFSYKYKKVENCNKNPAKMR